MAIGALSMLVVSPTILNRTSGQVEQASTTSAYQPLTASENTMVVSIVAKKDDRADKLEQFLKSKGSPMAPSAGALVKIADKYDLDWTFLPAIAGLESQYGKFVPSGSYNPYGWNNGRASFRSWVAASEVVAAGIRSRYQTSGEVTPYSIGSRYAESKTWAVRVAYNQRLIGFF